MKRLIAIIILFSCVFLFADDGGSYYIEVSNLLGITIWEDILSVGVLRYKYNETIESLGFDYEKYGTIDDSIVFFTIFLGMDEVLVSYERSDGIPDSYTVQNEKTGGGFSFNIEPEYNKSDKSYSFYMPLAQFKNLVKDYTFRLSFKDNTVKRYSLKGVFKTLPNHLSIIKNYPIYKELKSKGIL